MDEVPTIGNVDVNAVKETKLTETEDTVMTEETVEKIGGGFDSRGRRKSKYLSSPYTNIEKKRRDLHAEAGDLRTPCLSQKAKASRVATKPLTGSSYAKLGSKRFRMNWHKKFVSDCTMSSSPEFINASSDQFLSGLHSTAVDCMFPMEDKSFELVEWFFCRYRVSKYHDEAELAASPVNEGGKIDKPAGSVLPDNKSGKKRKNNKSENAVRPKKTKSLSGLSDVNANTSGGNPLKPGRRLKKKSKVEDVTLLHQQQNVEMNLNEGSGNFSLVPEGSPNPSHLTSGGKGACKKGEKIDISREHQRPQLTSVSPDAESHKCSSLVIDLHFTPPPIPAGTSEKSNGENKKELVLIPLKPGSCVSQERPFGNILNRGFSVSPMSDVNTVLVNKTGVKNGMEKPAEKPLNSKPAIEIPDLNGTGAESNSINAEFETVNFFSSELKSEQSKGLSLCLRPSLSTCSRPINASHHNRLEDNGESLGTCLLLQFAPGVYIPTKEDLMTTFCRFGPLKASETQLLKDSSGAQIVFVRNADATEAFRSIEQKKLFIFGSTLIDCKIHQPSAVYAPVDRLGTPTQVTQPAAASAPAVEQLVTPTQVTEPSGRKLHNLSAAACAPVEQLVAPNQPTGSVPMPSETPPPLDIISKNLQMMRSMLENSGNNLSPQMRAKLDAEIKNLMRKVNSRAKV